MPLHPLLQPLKATAGDGTFDPIKAAHLLNRCGFGGTEEEIDQMLSLGLGRAVERLMDFPDAPAEEQSRDDVPNLSAIEGYPRTFAERRKLYADKTPEERQQINQRLMAANREAIGATVGWWLKRMASGPHPLQEKLALFWHGHFTTSARDERSAWLMWQQNELLRANAAGNFRQFVRRISRDPAMLDYLNNAQNRKQRPNENYARELMELFTLGIGNYTEQDVKEAARAFTGWSHDGENFVFRKLDHDDGPKTFLGRAGDFDGDDVIDIILNHRECAAHVARRLWTFFAYDDPEPEICYGLGEILRDADWDLRPMLHAMFTSRAFYSERAVGTQVKSPIQLVVGTVRLLGIEMPPTRQLAGALDQMGQIPLAPPNVKGWPGGRSWINTSTLFVRYNTATFLAGQGEPSAASGKLARKLTRGDRGGGGRKDDAPSLDVSGGRGGGGAEDVVDYWVGRLIQRPIGDDKRRVLVETISRRPDDENAVRTMIQLIVSMPEYQLC